VLLEKDGKNQLDRSCKKEEVLHSVKEERNILCSIKISRAIWIGHILHRNCLLIYVNHGKIEAKRRRERRHEQPLDDLKEAKILEFEEVSTRSQCLENPLWKRL
jgi:hypothetical protein